MYAIGPARKVELKLHVATYEELFRTIKLSRASWRRVARAVAAAGGGSVKLP